MLTTRKAKDKDLEDIYEITVLAFGPYCMAKLLEDRYGVIDNKTWQERKGGGVLSSCKANLDNVFVAVEGGKVVGYATFGLNLKEGTGHVGNNAVAPAYQGRGIGTMLISSVVEHLKSNGTKLLRVSTMEHDYPARRVYEKVGFREIGRTIHYSKMENGKVQTASVNADDTKAQCDYERGGFKEIARSVHYIMELLESNARIPENPV